ncbi:MAG: hypothetical protein AB8B99_22630 [Phormidesmis sp.]
MDLFRPINFLLQSAHRDRASRRTPPTKRLLTAAITLLAASCSSAASSVQGTAQPGTTKATAQPLASSDVALGAANSASKPQTLSSDRDVKANAEDKVEANAEANTEANATYENQAFSEALYADIQAKDRVCLATGECGAMRYLFQDALMVATIGEFGSTEVTLIPHQTISKPAALTYAHILDTNNVINFNDSVIADDNETADSNEAERNEATTITETFFEANLPAGGAAYELGSSSLVQLQSGPDGGIYKVVFSVTVF